MENDIHLRINMKALATIGLWPLKLKNTILRNIHLLYCFTVTPFFLMFVITEYIEIIQNLNISFFEIVNNLSVSLLYTVTLLKIKICRSGRVQGFVKQIRATEKLILDELNDEPMKDIYKKHVNWNYTVNKAFMFLTTFTILPFFINPIITELNNPTLSITEIVDNETIYVARPLPFSSWFPFDKYKYYSVSFVLQTFAGTCGAALTCITDILFWGLIIFGVGQIKILQHKLKHFRTDGVEYAKKYKLTEEEGSIVIVNKCIILHQIIIKYFYELNKSVRFLMLMDFGICSMQIGVIGFQVIVSGFGWSQAFATEYLVAMLIQMFLFYWHANEITLESLNLSKSIWKSDFYACTPRVQKTLKFVMMRTQSPLTLKVGPFYAMSTETALSIVRVAYSYVALMRQVYK